MAVNVFWDCHVGKDLVDLKGQITFVLHHLFHVLPWLTNVSLL